MPERRFRLLGIGLVALLALSGCAARTGPSTATAGTASPAPTATTRADTGLASGLQDPVPQQDDRRSAAVPTRVIIPRIGVDAPLLALHRDAQGVLQAPPSTELDKAGWYAAGTVPGQIGPAVIAGHVDWVDRIAVFHRLHELRPGDQVQVRLSDGSTVRFAVDATRTVSKFHFPTDEVYGPVPDAELRLITCGGPWDDARNIYSENVVVSAVKTG